MFRYWNTTNTTYLYSCTASNVSTIILIFIQLNCAVSLSLLLCFSVCPSVFVSLLTLSAVRCIAVVSIDQMASPLIFSQIISFLPMHPRMRYSTVQYVALRCGGSSRHRKSSAQSVGLSVCLSISFSLCLHVSMSVCLPVNYCISLQRRKAYLSLFLPFCFFVKSPPFLPPSLPPSPLD